MLCSESHAFDIMYYRHIERIADKRVVLNVSQLNYAAVNLVTLIVLVAGVETARNSDISSTFVPVSPLAPTIYVYPMHCT